MLRTMIKVKIPENDEGLQVKIPKSVKRLLSVVSKINNNVNKVGDPYWFYNKNDGTLYVLKDYKDGEYNMEAIKETLETSAESMYREILFGETFLNTIRMNHLPMSFTMYEGLDFCVSFEELVPGDEDFSGGYDYSNSWDDICNTEIVETALTRDDSLSTFADVFRQPYLSEYGRESIKERMAEAPYYGVIPECIPIEQVISDLSIDFSDDYMLDAPEYDR